MKNILYVFKYLKPYKVYVVTLILFMILYSLINTILPYLTYTVTIDRLLPQNDYRMIVFFVGVILICVVAMVFIHSLQGYLMSYLSSKLAFDIRQHLLRHLQSLSLKFFANRNSGEVLERLNTDVVGIQDILTRELVSMTSSMFQLLFYTFAIFILNWQLGLLIISLVLFQSIFITYAIKMMHKRFHAFRKSESELIGIIQERISLVRIIQAFVKQKFEKSRHQKDSLQIIDKGMGIASINAKMFSVFILFMEAIPLGVLWLGNYLLMVDRLQFGALLTMWAYSTNFLMPIQQVVMGITLIQESVVGIQRVKAYFDEKPEIEEIDKPIKDVVIHGSVEFSNVFFSYEPDKPVLMDNSFRIEEGETVALVGESGSGKSTITNLIFRFYDPEKGEIFLDGRPLKDYGVRFLRKNLGVVFQETELFVATLRDNLRYGVMGSISDQEIMKAVEMSQLTEVIRRLPKGLNTMLEERGENFSGGEKQRIAICRLILKKPKIVIFDEATSALDSALEKSIQQTIDRVMQEPTSILIAHRLSTVVHADKIVVLKGGRVVEQGNHQTLLSLNGEYRNLWEEQLKTETTKQKQPVAGL